MSTSSTNTACQRAGIMRARTRRSRSNAPTADCATGWPGSAGALVSFPDPRRWSTVPLPWSPTCTSTRKSTQASFTYHLPEQWREFGGNAGKIHHSPGTPSDDDGALGGRFETACLDIVGHPADHRVSAGRQQSGDTPERQPVPVESDRGPLRLFVGLSGRIHSCELIPAAPAQPSLLVVMVTGFDNTDTVTPRAGGG